MKAAALAAIAVLVASNVGADEAPWTAKPQPDLTTHIAQAPRLAVEDLGIPVKSVRTGALMWAPNPDGKTYDLLQWYFKDYDGPTHVFIMDLASGELKQDGIPLRRQIHIAGEVLAPNGKLYLATPDRQNPGMDVFVYDPAANALSDLGVVVPRLGGEKRCMCVGTDGTVYGTGSYWPESKVGAYAIDPATNRVTDYGPIGPSHHPSPSWGDGIAADERYIYLVSGRVPYYLVAYDKQTGQDEVLAATGPVDGMIGITAQRYGATAYAENVVGTDGKRIDYWLYQGKALVKKSSVEKPPWPAPDSRRAWLDEPPKPEVSVSRATPKSDGWAEIWVRTREPKDAASTQLGWKTFRYQAPTYPLPVYRLAELPDGRIFGTSGSYEGNFIFDPATGRSEHLGKIHLSHYATALHRNQVYMSGYPGGPLYVYDPTKPWTANTGEPGGPMLSETDPAGNPRRLCRFSDVSGTVKDYGAAVGADGRVYFGGRWIRNGNGGGFSWWDPKSQTAGGLWKPFSNLQITSLAAASDGKHIVISTLPVHDPVLGKPTPSQGKLFVFDTSGQEIVREIGPIADCVGTGFVIGVGRDRVLGLTTDPSNQKASVLYGVQTRTGKTAFVKRISVGLGLAIGGNQRDAWDFRLGPDGRVWTYLDGVMVRINPEDAAVAVVGKPPKAGRLAFSRGDAYLASDEHLCRIKGLGNLMER